MGRRIVANVGMQKAHEKQGQANRIAADHAEMRIARRMTDEIDDRLSKAWNRFQNDYRLPLERRGELPQRDAFQHDRQGRWRLKPRKPIAANSPRPPRRPRRRPTRTS